jgi:hypothetical protein
MTMWSSIPARMEYACGHAALLSLPRIKGESSRERNERIAREKRAAQMRVCDFCTPSEEPALASVTTADVPLPSTPPELELPLPSEAPPVELGALAPPVALVPSAEVVEIPPAATPRARSRKAAGPAPARRPRPRPAADVASAMPRDRRRTPAAAVAAAPAPARHTYRVSYRAERVIEAVDILDAIAQAEALGATDISSLTRLT